MRFYVSVCVSACVCEREKTIKGFVCEKANGYGVIIYQQAVCVSESEQKRANGCVFEFKKSESMFF